MSNYVCEEKRRIEIDFHNMCISGNLEGAKSSFHSASEIISIKQVLIDSCMYGQLKVAKWLLDIIIGENIVIHIWEYKEAFYTSCKNGHLEVAKWIWDFVTTSNQTIDIQLDIERSFIGCCNCQENHLEIAKWLWDVSNHSVDIHEDDEAAFRYSCYYGNIEMVKWLWDCISNQTIDIHANRDEAFYYSYSKGFYEIVKFLIEINELGDDYYVSLIQECEFEYCDGIREFIDSRKTTSFNRIEENNTIKT